MADIAMVFHWQPQAFENMTVTELICPPKPGHLI
ncbi:GpE family phage tail protein [Aggregatibacter actinomycetemcomitans]